MIAFCVINWTLLKTVNPDKPPPKSFESVIVEEMLKDLDPVTLAEDKMMTLDIGNFEYTYHTNTAETIELMELSSVQVRAIKSV
ncbi:MAG: hypothetical protein QNK30_00710, partial [Bacteroidales bacterium]|nr:hypothetical protein [Bacteroidales bacterium]